MDRVKKELERELKLSPGDVHRVFSPVASTIKKSRVLVKPPVYFPHLTFAKKILCLHIKREGYGLSGGYKESGHTDFPDTISLDRFIRHGEYADVKYRLSAVIEHLGSLRSGHFLAYRRLKWEQETQEKWVYTSDESVQFCSPAEVHVCEAYMLFYERVVNGSH